MTNAARFALYCLLVGAPLLLASNRPVFWVVNGLAATAILVLFAIGDLARRSLRDFDWRPGAWFGAVIVLWAAWLLVQSFHDMPAFLAHPLWAELAPLSSGGAGSISGSPSATWATIAGTIPIAALGLVAMQFAFDRERGAFLLKVILATTIVIALCGFLALALDLDQFLLFEDPAYPGFLTGTFVGRNSAATYFVIGLACACALVAGRVQRAIRGRRPGRSWTVVAGEAIVGGGVYVVAAVILVAAILNTGSRAGAVAAAIAVLAVVCLGVRGAAGGRRVMFGAAVAVVVALVIGVALLGDTLVERLGTGIGGSGGRLEVYRDTLDMILARPVLGHGAGSFADLYPMFHATGPSQSVWLRAHNTYLQLAAELGIPMFLVLMAAVVALVVITIREIRADRPAAVAIAATAAILAVAFHALVDFSVQVQAVGLTVAVLAGAGLGDALRVRRERLRPSAAAAPAAIEPRRTTLVRVESSAENAAAKNRPEPAADFGQIPDGRRVYVFGDVHGRLDLLARAGAAIARDQAERSPAEVTVIGLGDYVDRGPDSKGVIEALIEGIAPGQNVFLRGNHEEILISFLEEPERHGPQWMHLGGMATLRSYGVDVGSEPGRAVDYRRARDLLAGRIPASHLLFLQRLPLSHTIGGYFFAHAGARPGVALDRQSSRDLLWIREGFNDRDEPFEKVVVHGHSPVDEPYLGTFRINLDTGAYFHDRLTCLVLEASTRRLLEV